MIFQNLHNITVSWRFCFQEVAFNLNDFFSFPNFGNLRYQSYTLNKGKVWFHFIISLTSIRLVGAFINLLRLVLCLFVVFLSSMVVFFTFREYFQRNLLLFLIAGLSLLNMANSSKWRLSNYCPMPRRSFGIWQFVICTMSALLARYLIRGRKITNYGSEPFNVIIISCLKPSLMNSSVNPRRFYVQCLRRFGDLQGLW